MATRIQGYYAILDVTGSSYDEGALLARARELLAARPCCLQLRAKQLPLADFCRLGHALRIACTGADLPLCINDRLDVALAVGADIIHLGQGDLPLGEVRRVRAATLTRKMLIGISTHNFDQAEAAQEGGADYIGFGPVFPTPTKSDADPAVGLSALEEVAAAVSLPVVAIGGITLANIEAVARAGAAAAAAIAAVEQALDRAAAGRAIARAFGQEFIAE
jgi:thiamine-phosphate pyrophosphorylase